MPLQPPQIPVFTPGVPPDQVAAELNAKVRDPFRFLLDRPRFRARKTTTQTLVEGSTVNLTWNQIDEDNYGGWNGGVPTRYTVQAPGWYLVVGGISVYGQGAAGLVLIPVLRVNGQSQTGIETTGGGWEGTEVFVPTGPADPLKYTNGVWRVYANVGDFIELGLFLSTESSINVPDTTAPGRQCRFELVWDGV